MVLYTEQQRSGGGAAVKTNFLREVLKRLSEEPRDRVPKDDVTAEDEASLHATWQNYDDLGVPISAFVTDAMMLLKIRVDNTLPGVGKADPFLLLNPGAVVPGYNGSAGYLFAVTP
jgi:hypothetical protein